MLWTTTSFPGSSILSSHENAKSNSMLCLLPNGGIFLPKEASPELSLQACRMKQRDVSCQQLHLTPFFFCECMLNFIRYCPTLPPSACQNLQSHRNVSHALTKLVECLCQFTHWPSLSLTVNQVRSVHVLFGQTYKYLHKVPVFSF